MDEGRRRRRYTPPAHVLPASDGPAEGLYLGRHPALFEPGRPVRLRPPALWKRVLFAAGGLAVALAAVYAHAALAAPYDSVYLIVGLPEKASDLVGFAREVVLLLGAALGWCAAPRRVA